MDREPWRAAIHGVAKSGTWLSDWTELILWHKWTYLQNRNILTDIEHRLVLAKEARGGGGMEWEFGISRCELLYVRWINNKVLLYSTGNYTQYPLINHNGKEWKKRNKWPNYQETVCPHSSREFLSSVCFYLFICSFLNRMEFFLRLRSCWVSWPHQLGKYLLHSTFFFYCQ